MLSRRADLHDFGRDILPRRLKTDRVVAYNFSDNEVLGAGFQRGTGLHWRTWALFRPMWQANMDLLGDTPPQIWESGMAD